MTIDTRSFLESADLGDVTETFSALEGTALNLDQLPPAVVSGTTLIDFSQVPSLAVRAGAVHLASEIVRNCARHQDEFERPLLPTSVVTRINAEWQLSPRRSRWLSGSSRP